MLHAQTGSTEGNRKVGIQMGVERSRRRLEQGDQSGGFCNLLGEKPEGGGSENCREAMGVRTVSTEMPKFFQISLTNSQ